MRLQTQAYEGMPCVSSSVENMENYSLQEALIGSGRMNLSADVNQTCPPLLFHEVFGKFSTDSERAAAIESLSGILQDQRPDVIPIFQGWLALLLKEILGLTKNSSVNGGAQLRSEKLKNKIEQSSNAFADQAAKKLVAAVVNMAVAASHLFGAAHSLDTSPLAGLLSREPFAAALKNLKRKNNPNFDSSESAITTLYGIKALTEVCAVDSSRQSKIADFGVLCLLRRLLLCDDYEKLAALEAYDARIPEARDLASDALGESSVSANSHSSNVSVPHTARIRRHAARLLAILSLLEKVQKVVVSDEALCQWLEDCANGNISGLTDPKLRSYARATLLNTSCIHHVAPENRHVSDSANREKNCPRYAEMIFLINPERPHWKCPLEREKYTFEMGESSRPQANSIDVEGTAVTRPANGSSATCLTRAFQKDPLLDVVFVHGLRGGPYKSWRIVEDKFSTTSKRLANVDKKAKKLRTFWPCEWLSSDFPEARVYSVKYKTNLTAWFGASLPLQDISSMLLEKLLTAGFGDRPIVFITHSMGGLVVKQMLYEVKTKKIDNIINNVVGLIFYSCPHFGSKLADAAWIGELRRGSPRLVNLNDFIHGLFKERQLKVLSFCEMKKTMIIGGIGVKVVPQKSADPGFGQVVELKSNDHMNSCKPHNRSDPSYAKTLEFLQELKARYGAKSPYE